MPSLSLTEFKDLAAGAQSFAVTLAVVIAGIWALWRFTVLREAQRAELEVRKATLAAKLNGTLHLTLTAEPIIDSASGLNFLHARIAIANVGNRAEVPVWEKSPLRVARVLGYANGRPQLGDFSEHHVLSSGGSLKGSISWPGAKSEYHLLLPAKHPGLYFVELLLHGSPQQTGDTIAELSRVYEVEGIVVWSAFTYVVFNLENSNADADAG